MLTTDEAVGYRNRRRGYRKMRLPSGTATLHRNGAGRCATCRCGVARASGLSCYQITAEKCP